MTVSETERFKSIARVAVHAEQAGFDVYAIGRHRLSRYTDHLKVGLKTTLALSNSCEPLFERIASSLGLLGFITNHMSEAASTRSRGKWASLRAPVAKGASKSADRRAERGVGHTPSVVGAFKNNLWTMSYAGITKLIATPVSMTYRRS